LVSYVFIGAKSLPGNGTELFNYRTSSVSEPVITGTSVADLGCFIPDPDPTIAPSRIRIPDPGGKKAPDPGSGI
jgi:hypothetical protein